MSDTAQFENSTATAIVRANPADRVKAATRLPVYTQGWLWVLCAANLSCALMLASDQPQHLWAWFVSGMFLPVAVLGLRLTQVFARAPKRLRLSLDRTLIGVGLLILLPLLMRLSEGLGAIDVAGVRRVVGVLLGGSFVVIANYFPERLLPQFRRYLACQRLGRQNAVRQHVDAASAERLLRFLSAGCMIAGALYGFAWVFAPLADANLWACTLSGAVTLFVGCRFVLLVNRRNR